MTKDVFGTASVWRYQNSYLSSQTKEQYGSVCNHTTDDGYFSFRDTRNTTQKTPEPPACFVRSEHRFGQPYDLQPHSLEPIEKLTPSVSRTVHKQLLAVVLLATPLINLEQRHHHLRHASRRRVVFTQMVLHQVDIIDFPLELRSDAKSKQLLAS